MGEFSSPTREEPPEKGRPRMTVAPNLSLSMVEMGAPPVFDRLGLSVILVLSTVRCTSYLLRYLRTQITTK